MGSSSSKDTSSTGGESQRIERRRVDRAREDVDWESKVVGRLNGTLHRLPESSSSTGQQDGWESSVLDVLRKRIEKE